jgi:hypothetical protein
MRRLQQPGVRRLRLLPRLLRGVACQRRAPRCLCLLVEGAQFRAQGRQLRAEPGAALWRRGRRCGDGIGLPFRFQFCQRGGQLRAFAQQGWQAFSDAIVCGAGTRLRGDIVLDLLAAAPHLGAQVGQHGVQARVGVLVRVVDAAADRARLMVGQRGAQVDDVAGACQFGSRQRALGLLRAGRQLRCGFLGCGQCGQRSRASLLQDRRLGMHFLMAGAGRGQQRPGALGNSERFAARAGLLARVVSGCAIEAGQEDAGGLAPGCTLLKRGRGRSKLGRCLGALRRGGVECRAGLAEGVGAVGDLLAGCPGLRK